MTTTATWDDLVSAALLGTERRSDRPPLALLDEAAVHTVRRRAGLRPAAATAPPDRAEDDPRPPLPTAARRRLALLLTDRSGGTGSRRGTAPDLLELLPQWLATANAHGYAPPPELLPALLDAARGRTDLRPPALTFAGPRARWLARLNPDWKFALRATPGVGAVLPAPEDGEQVHLRWEEGLFAERVALLASVRAHDPAAARALLTGTWGTERAEDRLMFLDSLRTGLGDADEPFLEQALTDRSKNVRATAAKRSPRSPLGARRADGGPGADLRGARPCGGGDRRGGTARVRRGDGAGRRRGEATGGAG